jgi:hypothetical protein
MRNRGILVVMMAVLATAMFAPVSAAAEPTATFTVATLVFNDLNLDGAFGISASGVENSIGNVGVGLYLDKAPLGSLGPEDQLLESLTTNKEGYALFRNLLPGAYLLSIKTPASYIAISPATQSVSVGSEATGAILEWTFGLAPRSQFPARSFLPVLTR